MRKRRATEIFLSIVLSLGMICPAFGDEKDVLELQSKSAILMDGETGTILYEKNSYAALPPASVTKIMTMLLILEGVEQGRISLDDAVSVSENASSMGGSQMYLEPGEQHSVEELLMGVAMVSANDA